MKLKQLSLTLLTVVIVVGVALLVWGSLPVKVDTEAADQAVSFANRTNPETPLLRESYFEYNDNNLHYIYAGDPADELVLFVHGFPSYWFSFIRQIQQLKADYHVVAIDGLGAGSSDAPSNVDTYKLESMALHVHALMDHLGADKVHLVGHDWGAAFSLGFAQRYPERVYTVTALSAPPQSIILELLETDISQHETFAYVELLKKANVFILKALGAQNRVWEGAYEPLVAAGKLTSAEGDLFRHATANPKRINAHINWYRANIPRIEDIEQRDYWPSRKAIVSVPALFIWGEDDRLITPALVDEIESISKDLELLALKDVGHWPHIQQSERVTESIRAFLSRHDATADQIR